MIGHRNQDFSTLDSGYSDGKLNPDKYGRQTGGQMDNWGLSMERHQTRGYHSEDRPLIN